MWISRKLYRIYINAVLIQIRLFNVHDSWKEATITKCCFFCFWQIIQLHCQLTFYAGLNILKHWNAQVRKDLKKIKGSLKTSLNMQKIFMQWLACRSQKLLIRISFHITCFKSGIKYKSCPWQQKKKRYLWYFYKHSL